MKSSRDGDHKVSYLKVGVVSGGGPGVQEGPPGGEEEAAWAPRSESLSAAAVLMVERQQENLKKHSGEISGCECEGKVLPSM